MQQQRDRAALRVGSRFLGTLVYRWHESNDINYISKNVRCGTSVMLVPPYLFAFRSVG